MRRLTYNQNREFLKSIVPSIAAGLGAFVAYAGISLFYLSHHSTSIPERTTSQLMSTVEEPEKYNTPKSNSPRDNNPHHFIPSSH